MKLYFESYKLNEDWSQGILIEIKVTNKSIDKLMHEDSGYIRNEFIPVMYIDACQDKDDPKSIYDIVGKDSLRYKLFDKNWGYDFGCLNVDSRDYSTITIDTFDDQIKYDISGGLRTLKRVAQGREDESIIRNSYSYIIDEMNKFGLVIVSAKADIYIGDSSYGKPTFTVDLLK